MLTSDCRHYSNFLAFLDNHPHRHRLTPRIIHNNSSILITMDNTHISNQIGLVLQGGAMRGVYTSGVLDYFMEHELYFPYVAAVSAGACNAAAYLARQPGLGKNMHINYLRDPRYMSWRNLWKHPLMTGLLQLVVATTSCSRAA